MFVLQSKVHVQTKAAGIGGVGICTNNHTTGEGVVFQDDLVNDTRAGTPEAHAILAAGRVQEGVNLLPDNVW